LNIGQDVNDLQITTSENTGLVKQYFDANNLSINPTKTCYFQFQIKQHRQESELKYLKNEQGNNVMGLQLTVT
jgi:hypothetical protein